MGKAVCRAIGRVAAGQDAEGTLQFVVAGFVEEIADSQHSGGSPAKENQLAGGSAFTERLPHGVSFPSSLAQVVMRDAEVHGFQAHMD